MSTPTNQPQPPHQQQQPFYPPQPGATALPPLPPIPRKKSSKTWLWTALAFILGLIVGAAVFGGGTSTATPGATKTIAGPTVTVPAEPASTQTEDDPTEEPTSAKYVPHKSDFAVKIKVTSKHCFGEAGCNLEYKVTPQHVGGMALPDTGLIEVTYKVVGGDEGSITDTFTVDGDHNVEYTKDGYASTSSSGKKLKTVITRVTYDENG